MPEREERAAFAPAHEHPHERPACQAHAREHPAHEAHGSAESTGCACCAHGHDHAHGAFDKRELIRPALAVALVIAALPCAGAARIALALAAYLVAGGEVLLSAARGIARGRALDESVLMAAATIGALALGEYIEAVAVMVLYNVGEMLQGLAVSRSRASIRSLMDIRPEVAHLMEGGSLRDVPPEEVPVDALLAVRPGERVPLDGVVTRGETLLDTAALTGESTPRRAAAGDAVLSGSVNREGLITLRVTKPFAQSTVSKILECVETAADKKAASEQFITKFARVYTPAMLLLAVLVAFVPPLLGFGSVSFFGYKALSILLISCPCALVISLPVTYYSGVGAAARRGVLVKGANYLESLTGLSTLAMDKTGTLTRGEFTVDETRPAPGVTREALLAAAACAEQASSHPIARSILKAYGAAPAPAQDIRESAGRGVRAVCAGGTLLAGSAAFLRENGVSAPEEAGARTGAAVYVARDGKYLGALILRDTPREDAKEALERLRALGVSRIVMLTGDGDGPAGEIARRLGIREYHAQLLPQEKITRLESLLGKGVTGFVGDGLNDAPVLRRADIGIAMGGAGIDAALEAADVVLMGDELRQLAGAVRIARRTRAIATQNIVFSLGVKALVMAGAVFFTLPMWLAIFADVGVALLCVLSALRRK